MAKNILTRLVLASASLLAIATEADSAVFRRNRAAYSCSFRLDRCDRYTRNYCTESQENPKTKSIYNGNLPFLFRDEILTEPLELPILPPHIIPGR